MLPSSLMEPLLVVTFAFVSSISVPAKCFVFVFVRLPADSMLF
ncbi:flagellar basal body protein [Listeria monocytogenes]|nr:flagellar basal body protein [Listeria monocytogenes]